VRTTLSAMVLVFGLFSTSAVLAETVRPKPRPEKHNVSAASVHALTAPDPSIQTTLMLVQASTLVSTVRFMAGAPILPFLPQ